MITDHVFRAPLHHQGTDGRPCAYMSCKAVEAEHEFVVDWARYQQCPQCAAALGEPCVELTSFVGGHPDAIEADRPHSTRKLRAGASRA